jgi:hypothetical protein
MNPIKKSEHTNLLLLLLPLTQRYSGARFGYENVNEGTIFVVRFKVQT